MATQEIKSVDILSIGETGLWKPQDRYKVIINRIDIYGYCRGNVGNPFIFNLEIFKDNVWKKLGGIKAITDKDFQLNFLFNQSIKTDQGNGTHHRIRTTISGGLGKGSFNITISIIGNELKEV